LTSESGYVKIRGSRLLAGFVVTVFCIQERPISFARDQELSNTEGLQLIWHTGAV